MRLQGTISNFVQLESAIGTLFGVMFRLMEGRKKPVFFAQLEGNSALFDHLRVQPISFARWEEGMLA